MGRTEASTGAASRKLRVVQRWAATFQHVPFIQKPNIFTLFHALAAMSETAASVHSRRAGCGFGSPSSDLPKRYVHFTSKPAGSRK
jgi:hypothetical protein